MYFEKKLFNCIFTERSRRQTQICAVVASVNNRSILKHYSLTLNLHYVVQLSINQNPNALNSGGYYGLARSALINSILWYINLETNVG